MRGRHHLSMVCLLTLASAGLAGAPPADTTHVLELREGWEYAPAVGSPAPDKLPEGWQQVALPHRRGTETTCVYRLTFPVPVVWSQHRVSVVLRASGGVVRAWVNGQLVGERPQTALELRFDISRDVHAGAANTLLVALADPLALERGGLDACRLEATGAVAVDRLDLDAWLLAGGAVVDARLAVGNHTVERFEGKLELALEPAVRGKGHHPVWRRGNDVRLDPGRSQAVYHAFEVEPSRLWRPDDPFLYRLTATVKTRQGDVVSTTERRLGLRSGEVVNRRWHVNGEWMRLGGVAVRAPGVSLLCPMPGQASAAMRRLAPGQEPSLLDLLGSCDEQGIVVLLDAPAPSETTPGWQAALDDLAAVAAPHPCVWGWVVRGDYQASFAALAHLRKRTPRLPIGRPAPDFPEDAKGFDFVLARFATRAVRHDNDNYGRQLEDLVRDFPGQAVAVLDRLEPAEPGDRQSIGKCFPRRRDEAARRWPVAMLFFELGPDEESIRIVEDRLRPFALRPPHHEARLDKDTFVLKTRVEGSIHSPVAGRMPCVSLAGYRIAWRAEAGGEQVAAGTVPVATIRPRPIEGRGPPGIRAEFEWRTKHAGDLDFRAELQSAAGRVVHAHRATLSLQRTQDNKVTLKVGPPRVETPAPPPPATLVVLPGTLVLLDLTKHLNNDGISSEANKTDGNFDLPNLNSGSTYPADQLPEGGRDFEAARPKGLRFRFPDKADGKANNVACAGQRLDVPEGVYTTLWLLAAAETDNQEGTARLVYAKSEEPVTLRVTDWCKPPAFGEVEAIRCAARHTWDGQREDKACRIWAIAVPARREPLKAVVLPRNERIHLFAATLVRAVEIEAEHVRALKGFFNNDGISWRANPKDGNFDLPGRRPGDTFIADLLPKAGAAVPVPGHEAVTFRFPSKDDRRSNNVVCDGQRLHLPDDQRAGWDAAWFLGACHNGGKRAIVTFQYDQGEDGQGELRLADWCTKPTAGEIDVLRLPARHIADGTEEKIDCGLVAWRIALDPKRKLLSITLPREGQMHVFAITLTRARTVGGLDRKDRD